VFKVSFQILTDVPGLNLRAETFVPVGRRRKDDRVTFGDSATIRDRSANRAVYGKLLDRTDLPGTDPETRRIRLGAVSFGYPLPGVETHNRQTRDRYANWGTRTTIKDKSANRAAHGQIGRNRGTGPRTGPGPITDKPEPTNQGQVHQLGRSNHNQGGNRETGREVWQKS